MCLAEIERWPILLSFTAGASRICPKETMDHYLPACMPRAYLQVLIRDFFATISLLRAAEFQGIKFILYSNNSTIAVQIRSKKPGMLAPLTMALSCLATAASLRV